MRWLPLITVLLAGPALGDDTGAPAAEEPAGVGDTCEVPIEELPIISGPDIVEFVEAAYPAEAEEQGLEGTSVLLVELDEAGEVVSVEVVEPAGHGFDEAAVEAVEQMRFSPAMTEAGPVPVVFEFPYRFEFTPPPEEPEEPEAPPPVNLDGTVVEMGTRDPVQGARVVVEGTDLSAITDAEGYFALRGVPAGTHTVRALEPGHVEVDAEITLEQGEAVTWRFWMRALSYRDNEAVAVYRVEQEEVTRRTVTIEEVERVPGTFGDPIKVVQTLPGAARSPFGTGFLVIRGADPEDSGVYVDGVRIPIIYHLTGTTSVISPELIESVDYLPGGYGVQYGRSMGGVVDVTTKREFEDAYVAWGTDILDTQLYFEGNLGRNKQHGLAVGARRSYIDAFIPLVTAGTDFTLQPRYWDYQVKWVPELEGEQSLSVFVYGFDDILEVATPDDVSQGPDQDTQGALRTQYASQRFVVRYQRQLSEHWALDVTPSFGLDYNEFGLGDEFRLDSFNGIAELRVETPWTPTEAVEITPGVDFIGGFYNFQFKAPFSFDQFDDPLAERETVLLDGHGTAWAPDLYLKATLRPLPDREKWLIMPGIRASTAHFRYGGSIVAEDQKPTWTSVGWDPRLATRLTLWQGGTVKAATGIYTQPPQPFEAVGIGTDVTLRFERSWNSSLGFEQQLGQAVQADVDLFYRDMSDLVVFNEGFTGFGTQSFVNGGVGRAYGLEVIARHLPVGRFFGWVSYTLSRAERKDAPDRDWYLFDFDQTHILSAQAGYDLPLDFGLSAQVQYVTGNPTSEYNAGVYDVDADFYNGFRIGGYNDDRLPPYFQTSIRGDKLFTFKRWQLEAYLELLHVVRGVNPEFTLYAYDYSEAAYVRGLPFLPNLGVEAKFWP